MEQRNSIACELCRTKKCRCDRKLPQCSQCTVQEVVCRYPQSNKRGIPTGYIFRLEQRLVETEIALFQALSIINKSHHQYETEPGDTDVSEFMTAYSIEQSKADKDEEWDRLPLQQAEQLQTWWRDRQTLLEKPRERVAPAEGENQNLQKVPEPNDDSTSPEAHQHHIHETSVYDINNQGPTSVSPGPFSVSPTAGDGSDNVFGGNVWINQSETRSTNIPMLHRGSGAMGHPVGDPHLGQDTFSAPDQPRIETGESNNDWAEIEDDTSFQNLLHSNQTINPREERIKELTERHWRKYF